MNKELDKKTNIKAFVKIGIAVILLVLKFFGIDIPEEVGIAASIQITELIILILSVWGGKDYQTGK